MRYGARQSHCTMAEMFLPQVVVFEARICKGRETHVVQREKVFSCRTTYRNRRNPSESCAARWPCAEVLWIEALHQEIVT